MCIQIVFILYSHNSIQDEVLKQQPLIPCTTCGRTFLWKPLQKHAPICEKTQQKKRKVFDSLKQRVEGTDLAQFHQKSYIKNKLDINLKTGNKVKEHSRWEENHKKLVAAIRSAKGANTQMLTNRKAQLAAAAASSPNEQCPFCERHFGPKAFDRHVDWCREHKTRVQKSPANVILAKERLEARTKYKVPPLNKPKRATIKEKYSTGSPVAVKRSDSICSVQSTSSMGLMQRSPSLRKPKSVMNLPKVKAEGRVKAEKSTTNVGDGGRKSKELAKSDTYDPFKSAERQLLEILNCDSFKPVVRPHTHHPHTTTTKKQPTITIKSANSMISKKRASVIEPPACFQDMSIAIDDDFELTENLVNRSNNNNNPQNDIDNIIFQQHQHPNRKYSDDVSSIDSYLINEQDDLVIPDHFQLMDSPIEEDSALVDFYSRQYDEQIEGNVGIGKRLLTKIDDNDDDDDNKISSVTFGSSCGGDADGNFRANTISALSRANDDLFSMTPKSTKSSGQVSGESIDELDMTMKPEELFNVDDEMYEEYKVYEEMYLKEKEQQQEQETSSTKKTKAKNYLNFYGIPLNNKDEENRSQSNKSNDSAYGSLSRKSIKPKTANLMPISNRIDSASSSSSENFPMSPDLLKNSQKTSKFCHECGNKYPLTTAKFCVECGVRRLVL